jgi:hypothetical protein
MQSINTASTSQRLYVPLVFENQLNISSKFRLSWELTFFNAGFWEQQNNFQPFTFILSDSTGIDCYAIFHLFIDKKEGFSPARAPYGSFEIAENLSHTAFAEWLKFILNFTASRGIKNIEIKHYPACYHLPKSTFIRRGLLRQGFVIDQQKDNFFIEISDNSFEKGLHASERRRLRKCQSADFLFEQWHNPDLDFVFDFINQNRKKLNYRLSFSLEDLQQWFFCFPDNYQVFCVKDGNKIASLSITVSVSRDVLYNFCPADNLAYRSFSPTVLLNKGLYEYCQKENIKILDLGISVDSDGIPKPSLGRFKQNIGAKISPKLWFKKKIG